MIKAVRLTPTSIMIEKMNNFIKRTSLNKIKHKINAWMKKRTKKKQKEPNLSI
jgi:hypothetical protein